MITLHTTQILACEIEPDDEVVIRGEIRGFVKTVEYRRKATGKRVIRVTLINGLWFQRHPNDLVHVL
ncbi:Uncharacterised protein [Mycobacteroides abscessus subsp. bolletii]|nr:hypothetical protein SEA_BAUDELAIRE_139 [Mycobacterium phage Baudelaire]WKW86613.1 hypothetical protein SEA_AEGEUS_139 [Mycobacterium phage Aegeus]SIL72459.1 Uncharacterised protein [Mycobacteroides abscessus subsp. abscessus]SKT45705.1 Uncharacterised protein [Mycobacteroides abscessus subsp. bolletii]